MPAAVAKPKPTAQASRFDPQLARRAQIASAAIKHISNGKSVRARVLLALLASPNSSLTDIANETGASMTRVFYAVRAMSKGCYVASAVVPPTHPGLIHTRRASGANDVLCTLTPKGRDIALALLGAEAETPS